MKKLTEQTGLWAQVETTNWSVQGTTVSITTHRNATQLARETFSFTSEVPKFIRILRAGGYLIVPYPPGAPDYTEEDEVW
ncbi:hypothetical protein [Agrobacterium burrii]|uniref:Uncharacterized protein n=1 Tax=Agrobacterium burrii TaxID=2815339 RepID=A0ABS3EDA0_9HYPH|nr:hypothetical protein [Agrobacterium burrii]MBO0129925.1 hypothetical protein [Agrobacterium burrii]